MPRTKPLFPLDTFSRWTLLTMQHGSHLVAHPHPERIRSGFYRWRKSTGLGKGIQVRVEPGLLILIRSAHPDKQSEQERKED